MSIVKDIWSWWNTENLGATMSSSDVTDPNEPDDMDMDMSMNAMQWADGTQMQWADGTNMDWHSA